ncbi:MAG: 4Fe-4S binding protein, partial [Negativicutes bacterium]|nr:4Fe-4S binding protein [Negativicutes bacterium]
MNCIRRCPTEAIRVRQGKARITDERCIDCGECIRVCPNRAKYALTDELSGLAGYRFNIALPAPSLYAQFDTDVAIEQILGGLLAIGFDAVVEVARGAELVSLALRDHLARRDIRRPVISNACPAVLRLIQVCFPELLDHVLPLDAPVEVAARLARRHYAGQRSGGLPAEQLGVWFISPCPAKMTAVRQPLGFSQSQVSGVIAMYR